MAVPRPRPWGPTVAASVGLVLALAMSSVSGAGAAEQAVATDVSLSPSASCAWGDVDIAYTATGAERRSVSFTAADGTVLKEFEGSTYDPFYQGPEHVLSESRTPPPPGTVVAVRVTVGATPPTAATSAEFFVLYRCDDRSTEDGGTNTVLQTCTGDVGACPATAAAATAGGVPGPTGAQPVSLVPEDATPPPRGAGAAAATVPGGAPAVPGESGSAAAPAGSSVADPSGPSDPSTDAAGETAAVAASATSEDGAGRGWLLLAVGGLALGTGLVVVARRRGSERETS